MAGGSVLKTVGKSAGGEAAGAAKLPTSSGGKVLIKTADEVNATFPKDWEYPYLPGTQVAEFVTTSGEKFVRVHGSTNQARPWLMKEFDIKGLTPEQIQQKFSLPEVPSYISDVNVPVGTQIRTGQVNGVFGGNSGATQFEIIDPKYIGNGRINIPAELFSNQRSL